MPRPSQKRPPLMRRPAGSGRVPRKVVGRSGALASSSTRQLCSRWLRSFQMVGLFGQPSARRGWLAALVLAGQLSAGERRPRQQAEAFGLASGNRLPRLVTARFVRSPLRGGRLSAGPSVTQTAGSGRSRAETIRHRETRHPHRSRRRNRLAGSRPGPAHPPRLRPHARTVDGQGGCLRRHQPPRRSRRPQAARCLRTPAPGHRKQGALRPRREDLP
jgi:hypothetical protein